jgi:hypothetical protein
MPVMPASCKTCPFGPDGDPVLRAKIEHRVIVEASQTCHSTGVALDPPRPDTHLCRGARDHQLQFFHRIGFLDEPTDAAWERRSREGRR